MAHRQRQRTERSRLSLLDAARAVYRDKGYQAVSVAEIAKRAGRAHGTFYLYFDNKHDVYSALLAGFGDQTGARFAEVALSPDPAAGFQELRGLLASFQRDRDLWELLDEMSADDESAARLRSDLREALSRRISESLRLIPLADPAGLDPDVLAELFASMIFRLARLGSLPDTPEVTALHLLATWYRLLGLPEHELGRIRGDFGIG
jgi:AcrR family transcriptional regulator